MHHVPDMIRTSPQAPLLERDALAACIEACFDCAQSCVACADACLGETEHLQMLTRCIVPVHGLTTRDGAGLPCSDA